MKCNYLTPTHDSSLSPDGEYYECLLQERHPGDHLIQVNGRYMAWHPDEECQDCERRGERCECFVYYEIPPSEAKELLKKQP